MKTCVERQKERDDTGTFLHHGPADNPVGGGGVKTKYFDLTEICMLSKLNLRKRSVIMDEFSRVDVKTAVVEQKKYPGYYVKENGKLLLHGGFPIPSQLSCTEENSTFASYDIPVLQLAVKATGLTCTEVKDGFEGALKTSRLIGLVVCLQDGQYISVLKVNDAFVIQNSTVTPEGLMLLPASKVSSLLGRCGTVYAMVISGLQTIHTLPGKLTH
jgi:hypothetical protein